MISAYEMDAVPVGGGLLTRGEPGGPGRRGRIGGAREGSGVPLHPVVVRAAARSDHDGVAAAGMSDRDGVR